MQLHAICLTFQDACNTARKDGLKYDATLIVRRLYAQDLHRENTLPHLFINQDTVGDSLRHTDQAWGIFADGDDVTRILNQQEEESHEAEEEAEPRHLLNVRGINKAPLELYEESCWIETSGDHDLMRTEDES